MTRAWVRRFRISRSLPVVAVAVIAAAHLAGEHTQAGFLLKLWQGDIEGVLEQACRDKTLTDALVAMSPLAGRDTWAYVTKSCVSSRATAPALSPFPCACAVCDIAGWPNFSGTLSSSNPGASFTWRWPTTSQRTASSRRLQSTGKVGFSRKPWRWPRSGSLRATRWCRISTWYGPRPHDARRPRLALDWHSAPAPPAPLVRVRT